MLYTFNPHGPLAFESMTLLNEHNFNNRHMFTASGRDNLTEKEHKALKELTNKPNNMIKSADKCGAIIVQSTEQ